MHFQCVNTPTSARCVQHMFDSNTRPSTKKWRYKPLVELNYSKLRSLPWWLWCLLVVIVVAAIGVLLGWLLQSKPLDGAPPTPFPGRLLYMNMTVLGVDPMTDGGSITVSWNIVGDSTCLPTRQNLAHYEPNCTVVNIFMDPNLFAGPSDPSTMNTNVLPSVPLFQFDPIAFYNVTIRNTPVFQTSLSITTRFPELQDSIDNYPFDQYAAELFMWAQVNGTNTPVGLSIAFTDGTAIGFDVDIIPLDKLLSEAGIDVHKVEHGSLTTGAFDLFLVIQRGILVKTYVVIIIAAMWLITLFLLAIMMKAVFFHYDIDTAILAVPVATLFAFTTLRGSLPGAPSGFGAVIDFVGTLPSLAILVIITAMSMFVVLRRSNQKLSPSPILPQVIIPPSTLSPVTLPVTFPPPVVSPPSAAPPPVVIVSS